MVLSLQSKLQDPFPPNLANLAHLAISFSQGMGNLRVFDDVFFCLSCTKTQTETTRNHRSLTTIVYGGLVTVLLSSLMQL